LRKRTTEFSVAVAVAVSQLKNHLNGEAITNLTTVNNSIQIALHRQIREAEQASEQILANEAIYSKVYELLNKKMSRETFNLRRLLAKHIFTQGYKGFYIIDNELQIRTSMKDSDANKRPPQSVLNAIHRLKSGEPYVVTHPFVFEGKPTMWGISKVMNGAGEVFGYFALALGEEFRFSSTTLISGISYKTGETYLVDENGMMLSESRFKNHLVMAGLLKTNESSTMHIRIADPGVNLLETNKAPLPKAKWPLTFAVQHALVTHRMGWSSTAYRDYRGVPVFGVWRWDIPLQAAIITEIDEAEAMDKYIYVRNLLFVLLLIVIVGSLASVMAYSRLRIRTERESNQHRNLLLKSTAEAIYGVDLNGDCTFVNDAFLHALGYKEHEVLGKNMHNLIHHSYPDGTPYPVEACNIYKAHKLSQRIHRDDESFWHKDGRELKVEYWCQPLYEGDEMLGSVVTFLDITEKRKAEAEREQLEKQVQHSQRLESLGVLAGGIAHDFNNLLAAILGNASLVKSNVLKAPLKAKERVERIIQSAEKAGVLCKQMLAYSGKGQFILKPINLLDAVEEMTHLLEVSIDKSVVVKYHLSEELPVVMVDEAQVQQVIMNLVTNANDAIEGKSGVVSITTGMMHADEKYLADCYAADGIRAGRYIYIEVSDTGCGMDKETIRKVFDPFFTTKTTGRGLGMSAVLGIVRGHKGALKVYSEIGRGTTFKFLLPVEETEYKNSFPEQKNEAVRHFSGGTALVVDDEETVREVACMMLEELGFDTLAATNGEEALELYKRHQADILFVLTDLTMPRMDGRTLFTKLRQINPDIRVVLSSGYNSQEAIQQFSGKGLAGFIQKPYSEDALRQEIIKMLGE